MGLPASGKTDPAMTDGTYATLRRHAARWLRRGRSLVLDATFGSPSERTLVYKLAQRVHVPLTVLLSQADEATLKARLAGRATERGIVSDARLELWPELRAAFKDPDESEAVLRIDATGTAEEMLEQALASIRDPRAMTATGAGSTVRVSGSGPTRSAAQST